MCDWDQLEIKKFFDNPVACLEHWRLWSKHSKSVKGFCGGGKRMVYNMSDELGLFIDHGAAQLKQHEPRHYRAFQLYFERGLPYCDLCEALGVGETKSRAIVDQSLFYLTGYLSNYKKVA